MWDSPGPGIMEAIALAAPSGASQNELVKVNVSAGQDVGIYGELYGSTEDAIMAYNKLQSDIAPYDMEISIPAMYEHPIVDEIEEVETTLSLIPYFAFANRGESDMNVWFSY